VGEMKKKPKTKYQRAIEWIAINDEPGWDDFTMVIEMISVVLIADVFMKNTTTVANDIIKYRKANR
jgi:hypothetical protein